MKLCCGTNLYASFSLEEALEEIKKTGIDYVDLWCCEAICQHANTEKDDPNLIKQILIDSGIEAISMTAFLMSDEKRHRAMEFAKELGIKRVIFEPAQSVDWPDNMTNLSPKSVVFGKPGGSFNDYLAKLREEAKFAATLDMKVCIEVPHCYTFNEYLNQIYRTGLAQTGAEFVIAPSHSYARGYTPIDVFRILPPEQVLMLYLWDVKKEFRFPESDRAFGNGDEQMPGGGKIDFDKMISDFESEGFSGWYNISCHGVEAWHDKQHMGKLLKRARDIAIRGYERAHR